MTTALNAPKLSAIDAYWEARAKADAAQETAYDEALAAHAAKGVVGDFDLSIAIADLKGAIASICLGSAETEVTNSAVEALILTWNDSNEDVGARISEAAELFRYLPHVWQCGERHESSEIARAAIAKAEGNK